MLSHCRNHWPLIVAETLYVLAVAVVVGVGVRQTGGQLVYPLDDTYIHMAMARNLVEHGVWGVSPDSFSSSTSSPLWTLLLAATYAAFGVNTMAPLILSLLSGALTLALCFRLVRRRLSSTSAFTALVLFLLAVPVVPLAAAGMEHLLHAALTIAFVDRAVSAATRSDPNRAQQAWLLLLAAALPIVRLEGCFVVTVACIVLTARKQPRLGLLVACAAAVPLAAYGTVSLAHGWLFLPNSVLLKGRMPSASSFFEILNSLGARALWEAVTTPHLTVLLILNGVYACRARSSPEQRTADLHLPSVIFLSVALLHLQFCRLGWLYRYEAYLVALGLATALPFAVEALPDWQRRFAAAGGARSRVAWGWAALGVAAAAPFAHRAVVSLADTPRAMRDRYLEHVQPVRFVTTSYPNSTVVLNDIGYMAFAGTARFLDLYGLGNMEPLELRRGPAGYMKEDVCRWAATEEAELAILQVEWDRIAPLIPDEWIKVAEWQIPRNVVFGDTRIGFFATTAEGAPVLASRLTEFAPTLPPDIDVTVFPLPEDRHDTQP